MGDLVHRVQRNSAQGGSKHTTRRHQAECIINESNASWNNTNWKCFHVASLQFCPCVLAVFLDLAIIVICRCCNQLWPSPPRCTYSHSQVNFQNNRVGTVAIGSRHSAVQWKCAVIVSNEQNPNSGDAPSSGHWQSPKGSHQASRIP